MTGGGASDALEGQAKELKAVLLELSGLAAGLPAEMQPDVKRALSEANLDINYVLAGGNLPCSIRLGRFREEMG